MSLSTSSSETSFVLVAADANAAGTPSANTHPSSLKGYQAGSSSSYAHDWSKQGTGGNIRIHGRHFVDAFGRVCDLRGVNLAGCTKSPVNHDNETFPHGHQTVTFVGRPFPLAEAHEHFSRLRRWGLTFIRFLVTWEAIEHEGVGIYDTEYLQYIRALLSLLPNYGMTAFVSLHQDVWSRYSGGSGAPAWTLEAAGFNLHALHESGSAWLSGVKGGGHTEEERGLWPCGYQKLAAATMATLFWAGDTFAPKLLVKGRDGKSIPIQQFLQGAFLDMYEQLAKAVGDLDGVVGFEVINEPHRGYIELPSLHAFDYNTDLHLSAVPSAFQSFLLGAGHPTTVDVWTRSFPMPTSKTSTQLLNAEGVSTWLPDGPTNGKCIWETHGVWGWDSKKKEGVVLRESYFVNHPTDGHKIDWYIDFFYPFLKTWSERLRKVTPPEKLVFVEAIPNEFCPPSWKEEHKIPNMVYAPHWYDLNALFAKAFGNFTVNVQGLSRGMFPLKAFYWGQHGARQNFLLQIRNIVEASYRQLGELPVVIGECGVPMDMNKKVAFASGEWTWQLRMMDAMITGLERSLVSFTLWNYNPSNDDQTGDDWNGENFSWFSRKRALPPSLLYYDQTAPSLDNGGRILPAVVRPYAAKTAGIPLRFQYEMTTGKFEFDWANPSGEGKTKTEGARAAAASVEKPPLTGHPQLTATETEIFIPSLITHGRRVIVAGLRPGDEYVYDEKRQTLFIVPGDRSPGVVNKIQVSLNPPLEPAFEVNDIASDFGGKIMAVFMVFLAIAMYWFLTAFNFYTGV